MVGASAPKTLTFTPMVYVLLKKNIALTDVELQSSLLTIAMHILKSFS